MFSGTAATFTATTTRFTGTATIYAGPVISFTCVGGGTPVPWLRETPRFVRAAG